MFQHLFKGGFYNSLFKNIIHWLRLPDARLYTFYLARPTYRPWLSKAFKEIYNEISPYTLVSQDRCYILYSLAKQCLWIEGDFAECGVYKGGTAMLLNRVLNQGQKKIKKLHLFDSFEGMPEGGHKLDSYEQGEFRDVNYQDVKKRLNTPGRVFFYKGKIPSTFSRINKCNFALVHIDVDIYQSIADCCRFLYPRLRKGGAMIFDDYGFPSCAGGRKAVDEYFYNKPEVPIVLPTAQAIVIKL